MVGVDLGAPAGAAVERLAAKIATARRALFITGAGVSADSGLPTYRGVGGIYEASLTEDGLPIEMALSGGVLSRDPATTWKYIHQIESACRGAQPNGGHRALAQIQDQLDALWVLTQNVDGFHAAAGSRNVIEIHGNLQRLRCCGPECSWTQTVPDYAGLPALPRCPTCDAVVRPDVVLFDEVLPPAALSSLHAQLRQGFDVVVAVGTSAGFDYIAAPVVAACRAGVHTVEINPGQTPLSSLVSDKIAARAEPTLTALAVALGQRRP